MDWSNIAKCVGFESLRDPESMVAAYKDKALNIELGVIGGNVLEELEKSLSSSSDKGLPLAPRESTGKWDYDNVDDDDVW